MSSFRPHLVPDPHIGELRDAGREDEELNRVVDEQLAAWTASTGRVSSFTLYSNHTLLMTGHDVLFDPAICSHLRTTPGRSRWGDTGWTASTTDHHRTTIKETDMAEGEGMKGGRISIKKLKAAMAAVTKGAQ